ncbi:MAG: hypothetical protein J6126_05905 [Clostridia bacterium]|nr:hypothetical protein [Clostridia bacterium]
MENEKKSKRYGFVIAAMAALVAAFLIAVTANVSNFFWFLGEIGLLVVVFLGIASIVRPIIYLVGKDKKPIWVVFSIITMSIPATIFTAFILFILLASTGVIALM